MPIVENSKCSMMLLRNLQEYWDGNSYLKTIIAVAYMLQAMANHEENPINWDAIIKSHKEVISSDRKRTGTVIAQTEDDIIISDGVVTNHQFIMPKSKLDYYDGSDVYLKIPSQLLSIFEVGKQNKW